MATPDPVRATVVDALRAIYPHGHPDFLPTAVAQLQLHSDKNHDYAAGGSALGNFERVSAILSMYPRLSLGDERVVALVYALKQLDAVLWGLNSNITHKVEGLNGRLDDIAVYANIVQCINKQRVMEAEIDKQFGVDLGAQCDGPSMRDLTQPSNGRVEVSAQGVKRGR